MKKSTHLAVSNFGVPACVGGEDSAQSRDSCVALKRRVLGQRSVQIPFDLVCSQRARAQRLLHQLGVITGVSGHVVYSACGTKVTVTPNTDAAVIAHALERPRQATACAACHLPYGKLNRNNSCT